MHVLSPQYVKNLDQVSEIIMHNWITDVQWCFLPLHFIYTYIEQKHNVLLFLTPCANILFWDKIKAEMCCSLLIKCNIIILFLHSLSKYSNIIKYILDQKFYALWEYSSSVLLFIVIYWFSRSDLSPSIH